MRKLQSLAVGYFAWLIFLLVSSQMANADTVHLRNGDKLSGSLVKITAEKIIIRTEYAGDIELKLEAVTSVATDTVVGIKTKDGQSLNGRLVPAEVASVALNGEIFRLVDLRYEAPLQNNSIDANALSNATEKSTLQGRAEISLESLQNKTQTKHAEVDLNLSWQRRAWRHTVDMNRRNDSEDGEKTEDSQKLEYSIDYFLTPEWFTRGNSFYQRDRVSGASSLHYNGVGFGRNLWRDENDSWEVLATYNKLAIGNAPFQFRLNTWLISTDFKRKFDSEKWEIYAKAGFLIPQKIPIDLIFQSEAGLRYQLNTNVYLNGRLMYDLYKYPGGSVKHQSYKLGIGTKW